MVSDRQKSTAQAIVNIFETGHPIGDYSKVTVVRDDLGHLTYGRSQTTLASGNLHLLIKSYCDEPNAALANELRPFLPRLVAKDFSLDDDQSCHGILRAAGDDPVMQQVQDRFFERIYWVPAATSAQNIGVTTGLGTAIVYDSHIHGSWRRMRDRTVKGHGRIAGANGGSGIDEQSWTRFYIHERRDWLANHTNPLLPKTVYRMDEFQKLVDGEKWDLSLPLTVRGQVIDQAVLSGERPTHASAEEVEERLLRVRHPFMQGEDVRALQTALIQAGFGDIAADGIFGPATARSLTDFQSSKGLTPDGIAGPASRAALGL